MPSNNGSGNSWSCYSVPTELSKQLYIEQFEAISSVTCWDLKANHLLRRMRDLRKCGENAELDPEYLLICISKKIIQHCFPIMISGMRSRNWQALLRYRLDQNCPPLFEEWAFCLVFFFFSPSDMKSLLLSWACELFEWSSRSGYRTSK